MIAPELRSPRGAASDAVLPPCKLAAQSLGYRYRPGAWQLRGVSLELRTGEMLGLVGPNGAGKSTLLYLLSGQLAAAEGAVELDGKPILKFTRREIARRVAILPQSVEMPFDYSCEAIVAQGRYPHQGLLRGTQARDREVVERCMRWTGTEPLRERVLQELSGGERQRVLLASVLAQEAPLLLLDEPTAALDLDRQVEVFERLAALAREGYGLCVVTHDLNLAARYCGRMAVLREGALVAQGGVAEVMREDVLRQVYAAPLRVVANPVTGAPMVVPTGASGP